MKEVDTMLTLEDRVNPNTEVVLTELEGDEAVLLHLVTKHYYSLNATGLHIWKLLAPERTLGEVSERLRVEFDITPDKAKESVLRLANELYTEKLVDLVRD
jgi:hypothetical protein